MDFKVGDVVVLSDGRNKALSRIDGVRRGHLSVGSLLFDWCGNEVDSSDSSYKIYPIKVEDNKNNC